MRIAIDIGGCLSKYPHLFQEIIRTLRGDFYRHSVHLITDAHPRQEVLDTLSKNHFWFAPECVHVADHAQYGDACKAVILRDLGIEIFIDDHPGYLVWPWPTPAPLRLRVEPDPYRPYWHPTWVCEGGDFGRRVYLGETP